MGGVYRDAWARYYSDEHVERIMRRAIASGINRTKIVDSATVFSGAVRIEGVHPLQFGFVRRKVRTQRRYGMPIVNPLLFYPWRVYDFVSGGFKWLRLVLRYKAMMKRIVADPSTASYVDESLRAAPPAGELDHFVEVFADKIPRTHGAPVREAVAG